MMICFIAAEQQGFKIGAVPASQGLNPQAGRFFFGGNLSWLFFASLSRQQETKVGWQMLETFHSWLSHWKLFCSILPLKITPSSENVALVGLAYVCIHMQLGSIRINFRCTCVYIYNIYIYIYLDTQNIHIRSIFFKYIQIHTCG